MVSTYQQLFGSKPSMKALSPLEKGDYPEINESEFLNDEDTQKYQSLIGALQWVITIQHFDISTAIMILSSFRAQTFHGHPKPVKCIYGYLYKRKDAEVCVHTQELDYSYIPSMIWPSLSMATYWN